MSNQLLFIYSTAGNRYVHNKYLCYLTGNKELYSILLRKECKRFKKRDSNN